MPTAPDGPEPVDAPAAPVGPARAESPTAPDGPVRAEVFAVRDEPVKAPATTAEAALGGVVPGEAARPGAATAPGAPVEPVERRATPSAAGAGPEAGPRADRPGTGAPGTDRWKADPHADSDAPGPAAEPRTPRPETAAVPADGEAGGGETGDGAGVFKVRLSNFEGPFDLLLQLIGKHKLDVTEVALSKVTDEFMAYIRAMGPDWDLDETTEFLVVAATLLDLKAARLLPAAEVEDEADLALLEARDLLFARLLQYRAYKQIADIFNRRLDEEARRHPRTVGLEPHHAELLPEVVISIGPEGFARLAVKAMQPKPRPQVYVDHIHAPLVSVQEQAAIVVARLRELGEAGFRTLVEDTDDTLTVVARFLALLELYREKAVALEQETALGELTVRWTGGDGDGTPRVTDEFDRPPEQPEKSKEEENKP
ncbi:segregation and condensation protein A [Streptomyces sennicomposti]